MRRYLQGTLDFCCGVYAVLNALSCMYSIDLQTGRKIFQQTLYEFSSFQDVWPRFLRNETDHYWVIRYLLQHRCMGAPYFTGFTQPFSDCLVPGGKSAGACGGVDGSGVAGGGAAGQAGTGKALFENAEGVPSTSTLYLPETHEPSGPTTAKLREKEAEAVWDALASRLGKNASCSGLYKEVALLRFHRFLPGIPQPLVSHWTTAKAVDSHAVILHDASAEEGALFALDKDMLFSGKMRALVRIVPESVVFLSGM